MAAKRDRSLKGLSARLAKIKPAASKPAPAPKPAVPAAAGDPKNENLARDLGNAINDLRMKIAALEKSAVSPAANAEALAAMQARLAALEAYYSRATKVSAPRPALGSSGAAAGAANVGGAVPLSFFDPELWGS